jgi:hypothetical protein
VESEKHRHGKDGGDQVGGCRDSKRGHEQHQGGDEERRVKAAIGPVIPAVGQVEDGLDLRETERSQIRLLTQIDHERVGHRWRVLGGDDFGEAVGDLDGHAVEIPSERDREDAGAGERGHRMAVQGHRV